MKDKIIIKQLWWKRSLEIISFYLGLLILLPITPLLLTDNTEFISDFRIVIIVAIVIIFVISIVASVRAFIKEGWLIEEDVINITKTTLGIGMKVNKIPLKSITNVGLHELYTFRLWPFKDLRIDFKKPDGSIDSKDIYVSPLYGKKLQFYIKEYAQTIQNNKEFDALKEFQKINSSNKANIE